MISRREFLGGASLALPLAGQVVRPPRIASPAARYVIPGGAVARWRFHGLPLTEGASIGSVTDMSGGGNPLSPAVQTTQAPKFTLMGINNRGGFCPGNLSGPQGNDASYINGALNSPSISLTPNNLSVLYCAQLGACANDAAAAFGYFGGIEAWIRQQNSSWPRNLLWYSFSGGGGGTALNQSASDPYSIGARFCGPVAGAFVNGYGGSGSSTCVMANRTRAVKTGLNWSAAPNSSPQSIGYAPHADTSNGNTIPYGAIWYELVLYNRAVTPAELDVWRTYCNQMYAAPLDQHIVQRVLWIGDSLTEGQGTTYGRTPGNNVAGLLANWNQCEHINYGVGSATAANWVTNIACATALYDPSLAQNVAVVHGLGGADIRNSGLTAAQTYGADNTSGIWKIVYTLRQTGFKVAVCTPPWLSAYTTAQNATRLSLCSLISGNAAGADAVIDATAGSAALGGASLDSLFQAASQGLHPNDAGYAQWAATVAPVVNSLL